MVYFTASAAPGATSPYHPSGSGPRIGEIAAATLDSALVISAETIFA